MKNRILLVTILAAVCAFASVGCGSSTPSSSDAPTSSTVKNAGPKAMGGGTGGAAGGPGGAKGMVATPGPGMGGGK